MADNDAGAAAASTEHVIIRDGIAYKVAGDDDIDAYLDWLVQERGEPCQISALSRQQVLTRIDRSAIPTDFPDHGVVIGDDKRDAGGYVRGWLEQQVRRWEDAQSRPAEDSERDSSSEETTEFAPASESTRNASDGDGWVLGGQRWSGASASADRMVAIVTSRGVVAPSGSILTKGPLPTAGDLAGFVWHRWANKPPTGRGRVPTPQIWLTAPALMAVGMTPPKKVATSADLSDTVAKLFGCQVSSAKAGWFTAVFPPAGQSGVEGRRVHLVLLPFLWLDPASARPKDEGMAGSRDSATELPDDEEAAVELLGRRIAWLSGLSQGLLPAARPASVGAALLDGVRTRARAAYRLEPCPIPDTVYAETPRLDPDLDSWKNMPHEAKGDSVDIEVDQRAAYLASAGQVELGYGGLPIELNKVDPQVFADKPPFGLWRVTTPPAATLDGLSRRLPLPHGHMAWKDSVTFWATTRAVQQLLAPVVEGGAGISVVELAISGAWIWPSHSRLLRTWADLLRSALVDAAANGQEDRADIIKNIYKAFLGRMASRQHPPGQRHFQQPAWSATIHADTRWRAMRYAQRIASTHGIYPIVARDIDTFVYRLPADAPHRELLEEADTNGKYRIKKIRGGQD